MRVWGSYWWSSNCWLSDRQPEIMWVEVRRAASPAVLSSKTTDWIRHSLSQGHVLHIPRVGASSTARCVFTWTWDLMFHGWPCRITAELHRDSCCCIEKEPSYTLGVSLNTPISLTKAVGAGIPETERRHMSSSYVRYWKCLRWIQI